MLIVFRKVILFAITIIVLLYGFPDSKGASLVKCIPKLLSSVTAYLVNWAIAILGNLYKFYYFCIDRACACYTSSKGVKIWDFLSTPEGFTYTTVFLFLLSNAILSNSYYKKTYSWSLLCALFIHTQYYAVLGPDLPNELHLCYRVAVIALASYIIRQPFLDLTHSNVLDRLYFWCLWVEITKVLLCSEPSIFLLITVLLKNSIILDFVKLTTQLTITYVIYTRLKRQDNPGFVFIFCAVMWFAFTVDLSLSVDLLVEPLEILHSFWTPPNVWLVLLFFTVVVALLRLKEWLRK